jgi:hypothetical protein
MTKATTRMTNKRGLRQQHHQRASAGSSYSMFFLLFRFFNLLFLSYRLRLLRQHATDTSNATAPRETQDDDDNGRTTGNDEGKKRNVYWSTISLGYSMFYFLLFHFFTYSFLSYQFRLLRQRQGLETHQHLEPQVYIFY